MIRSLSYFFTGSSLLAHTFCCILPISIKVLTLLMGAGLTTGFGLSSNTFSWFHRYELFFFIFSAFMTFLALFIHFKQQRTQATKSCCLQETPVKKKQSIVFPVLILFMFSLNLVFMIFDHH